MNTQSRCTDADTYTYTFIFSYLIAVKEGPDIMYVLKFIELQVDVTSMMCLIFIPKVSLYV